MQRGTVLQHIWTFHSYSEVGSERRGKTGWDEEWAEKEIWLVEASHRLRCELLKQDSKPRWLGFPAGRSREVTVLDWEACAEREPDGFVELSAALGASLSFISHSFGVPPTLITFFPFRLSCYDSCIFTECLQCLQSHVYIHVHTCRSWWDLSVLLWKLLKFPFPLLILFPSRKKKNNRETPSTQI